MTLEVTIDETQNIVKFKNTGTRTEAVVAEGFEIVKKQYEKSGPVRLLVDWTEFKGQPDAIQGNGMDASHSLMFVGRRVEVDPHGPTASKCQEGRASSSQANRRVRDED